MLPCSSETVVTREEAAFVIRRILARQAPLEQTSHFWDQRVRRGYRYADAIKILRWHTMEGIPSYDFDHDNHVVRLRGTSYDGRDTRLVLGMRWIRRNNLITIIDIEGIGEEI